MWHHYEHLINVNNCSGQTWTEVKASFIIEEILTNNGT